MARPLRLEYPGALYHVTDRAIARDRLFYTKADRSHFVELLAEGQERYEVHLYAYVLMTNHYHLVLETEHPNLSEFMHHLNTSYATWMNTRNQRRGHLYGNRYKAIAIEEEGYLLSVVGYTHLNPVRIRSWKNRPAKERLEALKRYPWSSYADYTRAPDRKKGGPRIACETVWGELGARKRGEGRRAFAQYIRQWLDKEEKERTKPSHKRDWGQFDPFSEMRQGYFLGGDSFRDFLLDLIDGETELTQEIVGAKQWRRELPLETIMLVIGKVCGVSVSAIQCRAKGNEARDTAAFLCREVGQKSLAEIGEVLGVKPAAVSLACKRTRDRAAQNKRFAKRLQQQRETVIKKLKT